MTKTTDHLTPNPYIDMMRWGSQEHFGAAVALGAQAALLLGTVARFPEHSDISETQRVGINLAREAWSHARKALECEAIEGVKDVEI